MLSLGNKIFRHYLWLPAFTVVTVFLTMSDRSTEMNAVYRTYGKESYFIVKLQEFFNDYFGLMTSAFSMGLVPCIFDLVGRLDYALSLA